MDRWKLFSTIQQGPLGLPVVGLLGLAFFGEVLYNLG